MSLNAKLSEQADYAPIETVGQKSVPSGASGGIVSGSDLPNLPEFKHQRPAGFGAASRLAGRMNARAISPEEQQGFLKERAALLNKKYESSLSKKEENRLAYVRWSLDRIEDAKHGVDLDVLEDSVAGYESFLGEIKTLQRQIAEVSTKKP